MCDGVATCSSHVVNGEARVGGGHHGHHRGAHGHWHHRGRGHSSGSPGNGESLAEQIAQTRKKVEQVLANGGESNEMKAVRGEISELRAEMTKMRQQIVDLQKQVSGLTLSSTATGVCSKPVAGAAKDDDEDEDIDLFGSDDEQEDAEKERIKQQRLDAYAAKKAKKPAMIAKSSVVFDVKPWDDETDMKAMEDIVRSIEMDGLVWGAAKLVPLAYGIKKLQVMCVVEDDKVSVEELTEKIEAFEDYVQSVDIAAFNKI